MGKIDLECLQSVCLIILLGRYRSVYFRNTVVDYAHIFYVDSEDRLPKYQPKWCL